MNQTRLLVASFPQRPAGIALEDNSPPSKRHRVGEYPSQRAMRLARTAATPLMASTRSRMWRFRCDTLWVSAFCATVAAAFLQAQRSCVLRCESPAARDSCPGPGHPAWAIDERDPRSNAQRHVRRAANESFNRIEHSCSRPS